MVVHDSLKSLISKLIQNKKIEFEVAELMWLAQAFTSNKDGFWYWPFTPLVSRIKTWSETKGHEEVQPIISYLLKKLDRDTYMYGDLQKLVDRLKQIGASKGTKLLSNDVVGVQVNQLALQNEAWANWLRHLCKPGSSSYPSTKWLSKNRNLMSDLDTVQMTNHATTWLNEVQVFIQEIHQSSRANEGFGFFTDTTVQFLRGLIWSAHNLNDEQLNTVIQDLGIWSFKKIPGYGPISVKLGNSCVFHFTQVPIKQGVPVLTSYKSKIKYASTLKYIEKSLLTMANSKGLSSFEIEEQGIPDMELTPHWEYVSEIHDFQACIRLEGLTQVNLVWVHEGKTRKTVPKQLKESYKAEINSLKKRVKDLKEALAAQRSRLESIYLQDRHWAFEKWEELYHQHPFVSFLSQKLIWSFSDDANSDSGYWWKGQWVNSEGTTLDWVKNTTEVKLWHPVGDSVTTIQNWRRFIEDNQLIQPFKQAHREIYILTDAEINTNTYSNRFAAHILRQHQFAALCKQRWWTYHLQGQWDSHNTPSRKIDAYDIRCEFWVEAMWEGDANQAGIFMHVHTDQVRFYKNDELLELEDVPELVFSEIMRDVDLFVGVTSIGNDPSWQDGGYHEQNQYWNNYSTQKLSESAKIRKELLQTIIGKMAIAKQTKFDDRYLFVKGSVRTYKIHLGSGNILMEPDNSYLCIVPDRSKRKDKVYLPFEGDALLSIILSKALLLARDEHIKDETILSQIHRQ